MILQLAPNRWSCLPTAFAIAIGCPIENLIKSIGHDGSEIIWPNFPEPTCRRGFHVQELIAVLYRCGYSVTPVETFSRIAPNKFTHTLTIDNNETFSEVVKATRGVQTGFTDRCGHAVAYDHGIILDPRAPVVNDFTPICAWIIRNNH